MDEELSLPFQPGDLIAGKYRMDAVLGAGGMGVVLAATHLDLDRKVAVKLIRPELTEDEASVERLLLEARAAARIKSEHCGQVLDVGRLEDGAPYIVMEFLEGRDLSTILKTDGALELRDAVDLLLQACEALAEAHMANIVHRDLKPENLFLVTAPDGSRNVKVLDFGISKQLDDPDRRALTNPTTAVGSPHYMSPEQMQAAPLDMRADIWALGAILYELVSGRKAFEGVTIPEVCARVLGAHPTSLQALGVTVPDGVNDVIRRCLSKDRDERFPSLIQFVEALSPFGSDRSTSSARRISAVMTGPIDKASPSPPSKSASGSLAPRTDNGVAMTVAESSSVTQRRVPKQRLSWGIVAAAVIAVLGVAGWLLLSDHETPTNDVEATLAESTAQVAEESPANAAPAAKDNESMPVAARAELPATPAQPAADAGTPPEDVEVQPSQPPPGTQTRPAVVARPPQRAVSPPVRPKPRPAPQPAVTSDAWDPDNFGGRR